MSKGANYYVYVVTFNHEKFTSHTEDYYYHGKEAAVKFAKEQAKLYGCGEFEEADGFGRFWLQATSRTHWVGVREIEIED